MDKTIVEQFNKYINSQRVYNELISMKCTQYSVVDIIKDKWNDIKRGKI